MCSVLCLYAYFKQWESMKYLFCYDYAYKIYYVVKYYIIIAIPFLYIHCFFWSFKLPFYLFVFNTVLIWRLELMKSVCMNHRSYPTPYFGNDKRVIDECQSWSKHYFPIRILNHHMQALKNIPFSCIKISFHSNRYNLSNIDRNIVYKRTISVSIHLPFMPY